ncbi:MAG TPA: hypothetical protein VHB48_19505 [Chitinophagaceae bacterium]|nr:hypothetical protein [Chitinophagaceae bacterium]
MVVAFYIGENRPHINRALFAVGFQCLILNCLKNGEAYRMPSSILRSVLAWCFNLFSSWFISISLFPFALWHMPLRGQPSYMGE